MLIQKGVALKIGDNPQYCGIHTQSITTQEKIGKDTLQNLVGQTPNISYFRIFGNKCFIKKDDRNRNFDSKCDEGISFYEE